MGLIRELDIKSFLTAPTPTVAAGGTPGATAYSYKLVAVDTAGNKTAVSTAGSVADGAATLDETDFNHITWTDPVQADFDHMEVYRTASGGTPAGTGLIGTVAAGVEEFDDTGIAAGAAAPGAASAGHGVGDSMETLHLHDVAVQLGAVAGSVTIQMQGSIDGSHWSNDGSTLSTAGAVWVASNKWAMVRAKMTALSGATPSMRLVGANDPV